jgi:hypothetical protein
MKKAVFLTLTIALFSLMAMPLFYGVVYAKSSKGDSNSNSNGGDSSSSSSSSTSDTKSKSDDTSTSGSTNSNPDDNKKGSTGTDINKDVTGGMGIPGGLADGNPPAVGGDTGSDTGDTGNQLPQPQPQPQPPDNTIRCKQGGNPACDGPVGGGNFLSSPSPSPEPTPTSAPQSLSVLGPDQSCKTDPSQDKCARTSPDCPSGFFNNEKDHCVPFGPCPKGTFVEDDDETGRCQPIKHKEPGKLPCIDLAGFKCNGQNNNNTSGGGSNNGGHNGGGSSDQHDTKVVVRTKVVVETKVKTAIINQFPKVFNAPLLTHQPAVLLLLDSGQICAEARDLECATTQNLFKIFNVITKFDGSAWHVSGQVKNVGKQTESNVQIIAHFYNSRGGNVNGLQQVFLNPMNLKSQQQGTFNIKAPISQMSGIPTFVRLELVLSS